MERAQEPVEETTGASPDAAAMRLVTKRRLARRPPSGRLVVAGLVIPALLTGAGGLVSGESAEQALVSEISAALKADNVRGVRLTADGPFVTAYVPTRVDAEAVDAMVAEMPGVSDVATEQVYSSKKERRACTDLRGKLNRATGRQRIPFVGETPRLTPAGRRMVAAAAELVAACGSARVYVGGHTDSHTVDGSTLTLRRARTMIEAMRRAGTPEERLIPRGYGAQYPVDEGDSKAAQRRNQRGSITLAQG